MGEILRITKKSVKIVSTFKGVKISKLATNKMAVQIVFICSLIDYLILSSNG